MTFISRRDLLKRAAVVGAAAAGCDRREKRFSLLDPVERPAERSAKDADMAERLG